MPASRCFSLVFGFKSMDFCSLDDEVHEQWLKGLQYILDLMNGDSNEAGVDKQHYRKRFVLNIFQISCSDVVLTRSTFSSDIGGTLWTSIAMAFWTAKASFLWWLPLESDSRMTPS